MDELIPAMNPEPGSRAVRFVGDCVRFSIRDRNGRPPQNGWRALLRTNIGRADVLRREIIEAQTKAVAPAGASWRDLPMQPDAEGWSITLPLTEPGYFKSKAYLVNADGWQRWPDGPDMGLSVHPNAYRSANTIYCAFVRMFGHTKTELTVIPRKNLPVIEELDAENFTVIPPSGTLRDVTAELPHIFGALGCRILHLLPVHPTPTTYARFGRFGSPYAALDLTAIDPALVVFDRRTTGIDQFRELAYQTHLLGGRLFLDIVINHTGWGSLLQENRPEWFLRKEDGTFISPGAWGTVWADLVELKHDQVALWRTLSEMFLTWCRRGVDGFRCDAGYKVPLAAWQYIIATVQQQFPNTIFLLEGLGGAWEATETLLTEGGMQWAYSELFQNYSGAEVSSYLDHSFSQSQRCGLLVHYSETHDNDRLAARGKTWSLCRNSLSALSSVCGAYGFASGVEWLASEKIRVHESTGMNWGAEENIVAQIARLNRLLAEHPCFFDGANCLRLSDPDSKVYALFRKAQDSDDQVLVLVNTDPKAEASLALTGLPALKGWQDLLVDKAGDKATTSPALKFMTNKDGAESLVLAPGAVLCLSPKRSPQGLTGEAYRRARAQAAWGLTAMNDILPTRSVPLYPWRELASMVARNPQQFLSGVSRLRDRAAQNPGSFTSLETFKADLGTSHYNRVINWELVDRRRITPVPPDHWLLIRDNTPFRASVRFSNGAPDEHVESIPVDEGHIASFAPPFPPGDARLEMERYAAQDQHINAQLRFLSDKPALSWDSVRKTDIALLTNGRGGMARICVDLGQVRSKYDCVLAANLHPELPVDRHIFAKRIRVWVNADGFISPLDFAQLAAFRPGPPAVWQFVANAGDGRTVQIEMSADMIEGRNTTMFSFTRPTASQATGNQLPEEADVRLTVRVDIEDRNFHCETKRNGGADFHFSSNCHSLAAPAGNGNAGEFCGFAFTPSADRHLRVSTNQGRYHPQPEWSENIPHPVEQTRGQVGSGDAYSPGWFELPLPRGARSLLSVDAEDQELAAEAAKTLAARTAAVLKTEVDFESQLLNSCRAFVVRRGSGKSVIAGYPWFLDWGRDTFICSRGLLAAGMIDEVAQIIVTFARFQKDGTLPNTIFGEDASNRDTSDAPLWFALVCEELAAIKGDSFYQTLVGNGGITVADTLLDIASNYQKGTPNGIRMDQGSALIWSPSHFTWMDTNYPAATPRQGYPVEIQALWIRCLRQLARIDRSENRTRWIDLSNQATASVENLFWMESQGYYADCLVSDGGGPAASAKQDGSLRSNFLFLISLGLVKGPKAIRAVQAASRYLAVPGALRTLAPLPVSFPLPVLGNDGRPLNDPVNPYWGRYEGDEDTRRKPAYHNGTAWTWTYPTFCEALAAAHEFSTEAVAAARAYLAGMDRLLAEGCAGHLPEIVDGDAPHLQRGCDAQAWGATEALRVWRKLKLGASPPIDNASPTR